MSEEIFLIQNMQLHSFCHFFNLTFLPFSLMIDVLFFSGLAEGRREVFLVE